MAHAHRPQPEHRPEDYRALIGQYLAASDLDAWPNTGVLLAASKDQETHEWEPFRAGVFSHEVRSGLLGAADTNGDGFIEYTELGAYVAAANLSITVAAARPQVVARPPAADRHRALTDITAGPQHFLSLPKDFRGRAWLEDDRGDRYADFNAAGDAPIVIALADTRYYLRQTNQEAVVALDRPGTVTALSWRPRALAQRGAVDDAFRRDLFGVGFGPGFYQGFISRADLLAAHRQRDTLPLPPAIELGAVAEAPRRFGPWPWVATGVAVAAGAGAVVFGQSAQADYDALQSRLARRGLDDPDARTRIATERDWSNGLAVGAGVAAAAALTLFLLDAPTPIQPSAGPQGIGVAGRF
ncbi:MAG: hypothetical protein H6706_21585 [Myxococcales bacterium]|nr:hypothetical protein [Myxococcales bacterium]